MPPARTRGKLTLEEVLKLRKTVRTISSKPINLATVSQLLWALQGTTWTEKLAEGKRIFHKAAPSAGKTFPLEVYVALPQGLFHYEPEEHVLNQMNKQDIRGELSKAAVTPLNIKAIQNAPLTIVLTADNERALKASSLLENAVRFVHLEVGHATQNLLLQATALGLGTCTVTSFNVAAIYGTLKIPMSHRPIYLLPIGMPQKEN